MKILLLTNLYPPHVAGTQDLRCQSMRDALRLRGHELLVVTSNHGLTGEQVDGEVRRQFWLNGVYEHPPVTAFRELQELERHNHAVLRAAIAEFQPEILFVWSLHGLSKSLLVSLDRSGVPCVFDVADHWLSRGLRADPWLRWWNTTTVPFQQKLMRGGMEFGKQRDRLDEEVPTRFTPGVDRLPALFDTDGAPGTVEANAIRDLPMRRLYFCSLALQQLTEQYGYHVSHGAVIYPGIPTHLYSGEVKLASPKTMKFLVSAPLVKESGIMTALEALRIARERGAKCSLNIYGRGDSDHVAQLRSHVIRFQLPVEFHALNNPQREMPGVYGQYDAFLHTSQWDEPYLIAPFEAMACGLPLIASTAGGAAEVLRHGENALTYSMGDAMELAGCMERLLAEPELRMQLAHIGQNEVLTRCNEAITASEIEDYLTETVLIWHGQQE